MERLAQSLEAISLDVELKTMTSQGRTYKYFDVISIAGGQEYDKLPYCLRIFYENCIRQAAIHASKDPNLSKVWVNSALSILQRCQKSEILFQPGRVVLQDFTGVAALVDLASMRDLIASKSSSDPSIVDSKCPADLVVDHAVQVDYSYIEKLIVKEQKDMESNKAAVASTNQTYVVQNSFPPYCPCTNPQTGEVYYQTFYPPMPPMMNVAGAQAIQPSNLAATPSKPLIPQDNPGLPVQEEICPFHQRLSYWSETLQKNRHLEMGKNQERFQFLKWVDSSFNNITVIPPGTGVMHQVNLEYLARVVSVQDDQILFPDTCAGTDTHTTMVNGLGVLGWTVGTLEAEAVMFGHPLTFQLPKVIGIKLLGKMPLYATSTDAVLLITKELRKQLPAKEESLDMFVEFFGPAVDELSIADRSAVANLCNEYNATTGFFPVDQVTLEYLNHTGREKHSLAVMKEYLENVKLLRNNQDSSADEAICYDEVIEVYLPDIIVTISGPRQSKEKVELEQVPQDFHESLSKKFGLDPNTSCGANPGILNIDIDGQFHSIQNGTVLMSSIASSSNTSNPSVMLTAGLLAKKAVESGLSIPKFVKRSLCPGSGVVTSYLQDSGVMPYLHMLGFEVIGYGCSACVENASTQPLIPPNSIVCCGTLSGNRNFEGRLVPGIHANYLASPPLVIAYAIAGRIDIDFDKEPIGKDSHDKEIFLKDIWPSRNEVQEIERRHVIPSVFKLVSNRLNFGNKEWSAMNIPNHPEQEHLYQWNASSTYIRAPRYMQDMMSQTTTDSLKEMRCLLKLGDEITCDLISPAGSIVRNSPAADYLTEAGLAPRQFHSFGARRGNSEVMSRGTFSHTKLKNLMKNHTKSGPYTTHQPSGVVTTIFEASTKYREDRISLVVVAGNNFGRGTARDWATKGPYLLGVRAILAIGFNSVYRNNMIKTGLLPVQIDAETYNILSGEELFELQVDLEDEDSSNNNEVKISLNHGQTILKAVHLLNNAYEIQVFKNGGVLRQSLSEFMNSPS